MKVTCLQLYFRFCRVHCKKFAHCLNSTSDFAMIRDFFHFAKLMSWLRFKRLTDTMIFSNNITFWESAIFYVYCRCSLNWNSVLVCSLLHKNNYNYTYSSITITITITITNIITITIYNNNYNYKYKYNYNYISLSFINTNTIRATM